MSSTTTVAPRRRMSAGRWFTELGWRHVVGVVFVIYAVFRSCTSSPRRSPRAGR